MAKDLHPKLLAAMFFFFALGATGGITALLTSDKPIFERYQAYFSSLLSFKTFPRICSAFSNLKFLFLAKRT